MTTLPLDLNSLAVESFETAAPLAEPTPATYPNCSAIDACPSRLCDTRLCPTSVC